MKYGVHAYIFTDRWSDASLTILDTAANLGADCLEIAVGDDVHFTPQHTRERARHLGLDLVISPGGLWPAAYDLSADDPADRRRGLAWHKTQVDLASELGAVAYTGALYGHPGQVRRRPPSPVEYERTAEALYELAYYAARSDVKIVLEPMSHFRTHVANTPEQIMRLIDLAGHANLWVLLDTYHMITEVRDYAQAIRTVGNRLWGVHACENDRGVPGGGLVPWDAVFGALNEISFDGYMLLEAYNSSIGTFAFERGMLHNVCPDATAFVRAGFAFIEQRAREAKLA